MMNGHWRVETFFLIERLEDNNWVTEKTDSDVYTSISCNIYHFKSLGNRVLK
jgi:hypothetical protein